MEHYGMDDFGNAFPFDWSNGDTYCEDHLHAYSVGLCIHPYGVCEWQDFY